MSGTMSLESSIRNCKVEVGNAARTESSRFLNTENMLCPVWTGRDTTGREACEYSFASKKAGCNSALDRVNIENNIRPRYLDYVTANNGGNNTTNYGIREANSLTGGFGTDVMSHVYPTCPIRI